jgi:hypothetical protein
MCAVGIFCDLSKYNTPIPTNMGSHMKTTIEISDALLIRAKALARRDDVTLRQLVEHGLKQVIQQRATPQRAFKLKDGSVKGRGLTSEMQARGGWAALRDAANER